MYIYHQNLDISSIICRYLQFIRYIFNLIRDWIVIYSLFILRVIITIWYWGWGLVLGLGVAYSLMVSECVLLWYC